MLIGITPFYLENTDGFNWRIPGYECSFVISISIQGSLAPRSRVLIEKETITLHKSLVQTLFYDGCFHVQMKGIIAGYILWCGSTP